MKRIGFNDPLHSLDTQFQTYGCRQTCPENCKKNGLPGVCAFASEDGVCRSPSKRWPRQYQKLSKIQGARL